MFHTICFIQLTYWRKFAIKVQNHTVIRKIFFKKAFFIFSKHSVNVSAENWHDHFQIGKNGLNSEIKNRN